MPLEDGAKRILSGLKPFRQLSQHVLVWSEGDGLSFAGSGEDSGARTIGNGRELEIDMDDWSDNVDRILGRHERMDVFACEDIYTLDVGLARPMFARLGNGHLFDLSGRDN